MLFILYIILFILYVIFKFVEYSRAATSIIYIYIYRAYPFVLKANMDCWLMPSL